ncbi:hypothetical protein SAMN05880574_101182 [Chryseobacterium sp. RU37D]|nr:hypothetical protein SAMN05880574_101182 [Chryseobacterium sp. RU37D]
MEHKSRDIFSAFFDVDSLFFSLVDLTDYADVYVLNWIKKSVQCARKT